jgi:hypothetical protein
VRPAAALAELGVEVGEQLAHVLHRLGRRAGVRGRAMIASDRLEGRPAGRDAEHPAMTSIGSGTATASTKSCVSPDRMASRLSGDRANAPTRPATILA